MKQQRHATITLDDEVARRVRIKAAEENSSVSRMAGDLLRRQMRQHERFDRARREFPG